MSKTFPEYPIYHVGYRWPDPNSKWDNGHNGTSSTIMLREPDISEVNRRAFEVAARLCEEKNVAGEDMGITVKLTHYEEWCRDWFSHHTFDLGLSDQEVLASFGAYVDRMIMFNRENQIRMETESGHVFYSDPICLMGAEDIWRWTAREGGTSQIGTGDSSGEAPCRCAGCREQGIVRIDH